MGYYHNRSIITKIQHLYDTYTDKLYKIPGKR